MRRRLVFRVLAVPLLCLAVLPGCGEEAQGVDHNRYESVYEAAMRAVGAADLDALWPLLTPNGRDRVETWLREWQGILRDPERGVYLRDRIRERLGDVSEAELERAGTGTLRDAWTFFLRADPRPPAPPRRGLEIAPDGKRVRIDYEAPDGTIRSVRLQQLPAGWYVDELQL